MEVFQVIGIIVFALLIYAATTFAITFFIAVIGKIVDDDKLWTISWVAGGIGFAFVSYCWIAGVPLPVFQF